MAASGPKLKKLDHDRRFCARSVSTVTEKFIPLLKHENMQSLSEKVSKRWNFPPVVQIVDVSLLTSPVSVKLEAPALLQPPFHPRSFQEKICAKSKRHEGFREKRDDVHSRVKREIYDALTAGNG